MSDLNSDGESSLIEGASDVYGSSQPPSPMHVEASIQEPPETAEAPPPSTTSVTLDPKGQGHQTSTSTCDVPIDRTTTDGVTAVSSCIPGDSGYSSGKSTPHGTAVETETKTQPASTTNECSICLEPLRAPITLSCGHQLCSQPCAINLHHYREGDLATCPLCREGKLEKIEVFLKTLSGVTRTLQVNSNATVSELQKVIERREGVPLELQRLIHEGHELETERLSPDGRTTTTTGNPTRRISDYGIRRQSTIYMTGRMRGGAA